MIVLTIGPSLKPRLSLLLKILGISALVGVVWLIATQLVFRSEFDVVREPEDEASSNEPIRIVTLSPPTSNQTRTNTQQSEARKNAQLRTNVGNSTQDRALSNPSALPESSTSPQAISSPQVRSTPQSRSASQTRSSPQVRPTPQATPQRQQSVQRAETRSPQKQAVAPQPQPSPLKVDFSDLLAAPTAQSSTQRALPEQASLPSSEPSGVAIAPPSSVQRQRPLPLPEEPITEQVPEPSPLAPSPPSTAAKPQPVALPPASEPPPTAAKPQPATESPPVVPSPTTPVQPSAPTPAPEPKPMPEAVPQAVSENVFVERFEVVGSTVFSPKTLALIAGEAVTPEQTEPLPEGVEVDPAVINRLLSLAELLQASEAITKYYTDRNYINSGAYIPQDALRDGVATIQIIEGSLEAINILNTTPAIPPLEGSRLSLGLEDVNINRDNNRPNNNGSGSLLANPSYLTSNWLEPNVTPAPDRFFITGNRPLNPGYIRSRLAIAGATPLNLDRLLEGVQLLQLNPLIESISTEIARGTQTGTSILNANVTQADTSDIQFSVDNARSPSVGSIRQRAQVSQGNFLGLGDSLILGYSRTEGSEGWDASYSLPINARNGTLSFSLGDTSSEVIEDPFNFLDIQSRSRYYELTLRQPVILTTTEEVALSLTASRRESESEFLQGLTGIAEPFPGVGADAEGNTQVSALRFSQEWTKQGEEYVLALQSEFSLGLNAFNSTINPIPPDSRFFSWRGRGQWVRRLGDDTLLLLRGELQLADRPLVPLQQFGIGGQETIRGYRQDTLLTDNGWLAGVELRLPILRIPEVDGVLQLAPFLEVGRGWNSGDSTDPENSVLASTGIGLLWRQDNLSARLDWGIPLTSFSSSGETLQENGIHFSLIYSPF
ncbi:BamA/TamA family outer membrane protein [Microcoleus sp. FACHB-SPT15]|uniref:ShlB/FhaC/HecB family hemolysin secretion/activation protein n=1 Tax=Microcoleus sp. FACHB-SPT15 TaxID=2692830 RepID=UPI00177B85A4|nr:ShlB/FhaC/HecB family hemolysin secretion/activation protein [Microcoleus sp. FACHB-SPT15]MBD1805368.1 BamA/TamA family outer membrane protein [Microcoleus sp. FACHB-SPT15]